MKFDQTLMNFVNKNLDKNLIPMLLGEPGIGKSSWVKALATLRRTKVFSLACNQLADKADVTGARLVPVYGPELDENGNPTGTQIIKDYKQVFYPHAVIHDAIEYAIENPRETPILFLDEINRTNTDVTSELLSLPTERRIGSKDLPENLRIIIAGNDKGNVIALDEASISRFVLYRTEPDVPTFIAANPELNVFVKNVLNAHPECIFGRTISVNATKNDDDDDDVSIDEILENDEDMAQITTPRTLTAVSEFLNSFSNQELMEALASVHIVDGQEINDLQEAIEGHIGKTLFATFLLAEIANNIMSTNNQMNATTISKPTCYDDMKQCADMQTLNTFVANLSDNEKSGCLLYAIYEKEDNKIFINTLAPQIDKLMPTDMKTLMTLASADKLDNENVHALLKTQSTISQALSVILEM